MTQPRRNYAGAEAWPRAGTRHLGQWSYGHRERKPETLPDVLPHKPTIEQLWQLEDIIAASAGAYTDGEQFTTHHFADGLYGRELFIPAGTMLTGKMHRGRHLNILAQGEIVVATTEGRKHLKAPAVIVSEPGTKRAGLAITDVVWITVHASEETDLDALEAEIIEPEGPLRLAAGFKALALTTDGESKA